MKTVIFSQIFFITTILTQSHLLRDAPYCDETACKIENNCRCSSTVSPLNNSADPAPQLIAITVSESVVGTVYNNYIRPLFFDRVNPDGNPIGLTFFVSHEYTDYTLVQDLYLRGYEIGVHSITKNPLQSYWRNASVQDLYEEFGGQRTIISTFANIPVDDIVGARTPQLQLEGDKSIEAYILSGVEYDNSLPTEYYNPLLPYTLDYRTIQDCIVSVTCPTESHPGFWIAPLTDIVGVNNTECNSLVTCLVEGTPEHIASWLLSEVNRVRATSRSPLVLQLDSYWFSFTENSFEGFLLFLEEIVKYEDTFLVSVQDIINWVKNPVPARSYRSPAHYRTATCKPVNCELFNQDGNIRYMKSCIPCPLNYPWKGNPLGQ